MAVSKLWSINEGGLSRVLQYAANPKKTNNKLYVIGINCEPETAYEEFTAVKRSYAKTGGIEAYHGYLSFKEQDITPELSLKIGTEFAQEVWGNRFQVLVTVHTDTDHPQDEFCQGYFLPKLNFSFRLQRTKPPIEQLISAIGGFVLLIKNVL